MGAAPSPTVRLAVSGADYRSVAALMREYVASLPFELDFQNFEGELARLEAEFGLPDGAAFLAEIGKRAVGVAAIRRLGPRLAELKRMYIRPDARGRGLGKLLTRHAVAAGRRLGATRMMLDTDLDSMPTANAMYESLGFTDAEPYRDNPLPGARFMSLDLATVPEPPPVGVVLAGGSSRRMGIDKARVVLGGRSMVDHALSALSSAGLDTIIAGGPPHPAAPTIADAPGVGGPASGLAAAFRASPGADVVLVAVDQPYASPDTLRRLLATPGDAVVPLDGRRQSTCAVYRDACAPVLERLVAADAVASLQRLIDEVDATVVLPDTWREWGEDGRSWRGIDTPDALNTARASWPEAPHR